MFNLSIDTGNAAFSDNNAPYEIARILRECANRIERNGLSSRVKLYDINGNNVGCATMSEES